MKRRQLLFSILVSSGIAPAMATKWPEHPIKLVVPFPPGGSTDALARFIAQGISESLGQTVVVENRTGAAGNLGTDYVVKSNPDGYTLAISTSGPLANNKLLYSNLPYDPLSDIAPIVALGEIPIGLAVSSKSRFNSLHDLLNYERLNPGSISVGNPGKGTIGHLTVELLNKVAKTNFLSVPYRGDAPVISDALGGIIDAVSMPITTLIPQVAAGKMRCLAVSSQQRSEVLPDTRTLREEGIAIDSSVWMAIVAPKNVDSNILSIFNREINRIIDSEGGKNKFSQYGATLLGGSEQSLSKIIKTESEKWRDIIISLDIKLD